MLLTEIGKFIYFYIFGLFLRGPNHVSDVFCLESKIEESKCPIIIWSNLQVISFKSGWKWKNIRFKCSELMPRRSSEFYGHFSSVLKLEKHLSLRPVNTFGLVLNISEIENVSNLQLKNIVNQCIKLCNNTEFIPLDCIEPSLQSLYG